MLFTIWHGNQHMLNDLGYVCFIVFLYYGMGNQMKDVEIKRLGKIIYLLNLKLRAKNEEIRFLRRWKFNQDHKK